MSFGSFIYRQSLASLTDKRLPARLRAGGFRLLRKAMLRFTDPACRMDIRGKILWLPLSHQLPFYVSPDANYDKLLGRVSDFIRTAEGQVCGIDVGANIGDTITACANGDKDRFLAIEPNPVFFEYLKKNLARLPASRLLQAVCTSEDRTTTYNISTVHGTAQFAESTTQGLALETKCLDTILEQFTEFKKCNFVKIDTDGYDFEVIRGARKMIAAARPAVLFECDVFGNANYFEDTLQALRFFGETGYRHALVYDHTGFLFSQISLNNTLDFPQALFYQLTSQRCYFDILVMRDAGEFLRQELDYFINSTANAERRQAAEKAAKKILERLAHT